MISLLKSLWHSLCPADDLTAREKKLAQRLVEAEKAGRVHIDRDGMVSINFDHPDVIAELKRQGALANRIPLSCEIPGSIDET